MHLRILLLKNMEAPDPLATVDAAFGRIGHELFATAKALTFLIITSLISYDPVMMPRA